MSNKSISIPPAKCNASVLLERVKSEYRYEYLEDEADRDTEIYMCITLLPRCIPEWYILATSVTEWIVQWISLRKHRMTYPYDTVITASVFTYTRHTMTI